MLKPPFNPFLRDEQVTDLTTGGGAATQEAPAAAAEAPPVVAAAAEPREPSILERAQAAFQSKGALLTRATDAEAQLATARESIATQAAEIAALQAKNASLLAERDQAHADLAEIGKLLDQAKAEAATAEDRALDIVATTGLRALDLPPAQSEPVEDIDAVHARLVATTDPKEKAVLARKVRDLRHSSN